MDTLIQKICVLDNETHLGAHIPTQRRRAHFQQATSFLSRGSMVCGMSGTSLSKLMTPFHGYFDPENVCFRE